MSDCPECPGTDHPSHRQRHEQRAGHGSPAGESHRVTPQTMRVTVTVELDHHTLGRVRLSKATGSSVGQLRDMTAKAGRLHDESTRIVMAQLRAITSDAGGIPHASD